MVSKTEYDIALSYAREDGKYVAQVAAMLRQLGLVVFFDRFEKAKLWGKDLYQHLAKIYQHKARYCVVFISKHYAAKNWTNHELKSIQARQFDCGADYLLPAYFDETELPGIPKTIGSIFLHNTSIDEFVKLIYEKATSEELEKTNIIESSDPNANQKLLAHRIGDKDSGAYFLEADLPYAIKKAVDMGVCPSAVFLDIDDLTVINKVYGINTGNSVLSGIFDVVKRITYGKVKYFGRCGDDTFYSIIYDNQKVIEYCNKVHREIRQYGWNYIEKGLRVSCTIGYSTLESGSGAYQWLAKALNAMSEGKHESRGKSYCGDNLPSIAFENDEPIIIISRSKKSLSPKQQVEHDRLMEIYGSVSGSVASKLKKVTAAERYQYLKDVEKVQIEKKLKLEAERRAEQEKRRAEYSEKWHSRSFSIRDFCS